MLSLAPARAHFFHMSFAFFYLRSFMCAYWLTRQLLANLNNLSDFSCARISNKFIFLLAEYAVEEAMAPLSVKFLRPSHLKQVQLCRTEVFIIQKRLCKRYYSLLEVARIFLTSPIIPPEIFLLPVITIVLQTPFERILRSILMKAKFLRMKNTTGILYSVVN